ncbi:hypothetical protein J6590_019110 [Homalodisca vitripennis]|nr:hypothetical protein J6590_019110 [Homalodisca vitripennis]
MNGHRLCDDFIKQNKEESRYNTNSTTLIRIATASTISLVESDVDDYIVMTLRLSIRSSVFTSGVGDTISDAARCVSPLPSPPPFRYHSLGACRRRGSSYGTKETAGMLYKHACQHNRTTA